MPANYTVPPLVSGRGLLILEPVFHFTAGAILLSVEFEPVFVAGTDHEAGLAVHES
jgi:hypothetical protein